MKIEAVTVCVNYADFLAEVAPFNFPHLERWVIVTTPADHATREVCRKFSLECVLTEEHARDGKFSKGRMIDRGMSMLTGSDWMLHLDADIALPTDLKPILRDAHLDESQIHGCDRLNVQGLPAWQRVKAAGLMCKSNPWLIGMHRPDCQIGARVANTGHGYSPIGFFQLWHGSEAIWRSLSQRRYPYHDGTAAHSDVGHSLQWDRRKRVLIPELLVWHLESESAPMGANWNGRTTAAFGASKPIVGYP